MIQLARLYALVNVAMADAGIAIWESKYYYDFWRPVTGIREADPGTGPTGAGDGNPETLGDIGFIPLSPRTFSSFSQAEEENGQSRIYLGIHWEFDKTQGIAQGRRVADYVFNNAFRPARQ